MREFLITFFLILIFMSCKNDENQSLVKNTSQDTSQLEIIFPELCFTTITDDHLTERKELKLRFPEECDSLNIYFPKGGTISSATLYEDTLMKEIVGSTGSFGYGLLDDNNGFMTISNERKGKFFLVYSSCHWGSEMWIELE